MAHSPGIEAARTFLKTVWDGEIPSDEALLAALDELVATYHQTPSGDASDDDVDAPRESGAELYKRVADRFSDYGLYPVANPRASLDDALMMGDPIDDLADITLDMREVVWLADHVGLDEAHWTFRLLFFHWGQHARELSIYLCGRVWG